MNDTASAHTREGEARLSGRLPLGAAVSGWMERYSLLWLAGLLALCTLHLLSRSAEKWIWYDELFTLNLAQQNTFAHYWYGLAADGQPPLGSMLAWLSVHLFGTGALASRLPSLVAFTLASLLVYRIVRVRLGRVAGLLAAVLLNTNPLISVYAIEARPYALVLFFTVAAFASWQLATDEKHPRSWARWAIAACIAGALLSHHYGVINVGLPLLAGEITRSIRRHRMDWPLAACASAGLLALAITFPLIQRTQHALLQYSNLPRGLPHGLGNPFHAADYDSVLAIDNTGFAKVLLLLFVALLLRTWWKERGKKRGVRPQWSTRFGWPTHELVALLASSLGLLAIFFISSMGNVFFSRIRYGIGSYFGIVALLTTLFALFDTQVQAVLVLLLAWPILKPPHLHLHSQAEPAEMACLRTLPQLPIVVADTIKYPPYWHYVGPSLRQRVVYLLDRDYLQKQRYTTPELAMFLQKPIFPMGLADFTSYVNTHPDLFVILHGDPVLDYQADHLRESGYRFTPVSLPGCPAGRVFSATR